MTTKLPDPFQIADGLELPEIERRTMQSAEHLAEMFLRYRSLIDAVKRADAIIAWFTWCEIQRWVQEGESPVFSLEEWENFGKDDMFLVRVWWDIYGKAKAVPAALASIYSVITCRLPRKAIRMLETGDG